MVVLWADFPELRVEHDGVTYACMVTISSTGSARSRSRQPLSRSSPEHARHTVRVDSQTELVIAADIAERLGISPARVHVLVSGPGSPSPSASLAAPRCGAGAVSNVGRIRRAGYRLHTRTSISEAEIE